MENNLIYGDTLQEMKKLADNSIDHIICDLPFFGVVKDSWDNQWKDEDDYLKWITLIVTEYKRILRQNGNIFLFTSRQYNRKICNILDTVFVEKRTIIWARKRAFNTTRGKALASGYEPICYYCNGDKGIFNTIKIKVNSKRKEYTTGILKDGITLSDVWTDIAALPHNSKEKVKHSTQKPLALIERIIKIGTSLGDTILDNCSGSGTLAVAALNTNRKYICIENDKKSYDIGVDRVKQIKELLK